MTTSAQVSYSYVAKYVARRRAEITAQDRGQDEGLAGFVPQVREPGAEAEVDFGDVTVELGGQLSRCFLFAYRPGARAGRAIEPRTGSAKTAAARRSTR